MQQPFAGHGQAGLDEGEQEAQRGADRTDKDAEDDGVLQNLQVDHGREELSVSRKCVRGQGFGKNRDDRVNSAESDDYHTDRGRRSDGDGLASAAWFFGRGRRLGQRSSR
ncbi:hypothetical protein [Dactylosporangium darangshiense]|uniref:hypothetical protein n=1 Tax=Dactylosporangium darangshiense TaxID=579108 RepID=UPI003643177E